MKRVSFPDLYAYVKAISFLKGFRIYLSDSAKIQQVLWRGPEGFLTNLQSIFDFHQQYVSESPSCDQLIDTIRKVLDTFKKSDLDQPIINSENYKTALIEIINLLDKLEIGINQFYSSNAVFQFSNTVFQGDILFGRIGNVFQGEVWEFVPGSAKSDIEEGGKALLFNLPTCASFMFLRALEDCMRKLCKEMGHTAGHLMFGKAIDFISDNSTEFDLEPKFFKRQLDLLNYIKDEFRNPSAHPEKAFSQSEAEQLFQVVNVAIDKIFRLNSSLKKRA